ncbi:MAG: HAMP domain-containing sensor histidine kinase, partial [Elusimicrobiota bacterium]|nr:HAMP domain-containing sensor histidine kinase [Elusimicrobiota bacterium]
RVPRGGGFKMVKILTRALSYNWKYYAAAVAVFVAFWQIFSVFSATRVADDKLLTAMRQNAAYFEKAFLEGDVFETQRIMWRIKNENIKRITFHPVVFEGSKWIFKEAIVGNLYDRPRAQVNRNIPFISNGAELGRLAYVIDLVDVNSAVFGQNYVLFITVVFFFMGLLALSNVGAIKTIFSIERCVDETNALATAGEHSKIQDSIQRSIQSLPESLRATPFAVLIGRLAEVLQKASRLESELAVSKATSDLAAQVAHDIRSPLAALGAAAKGLEMPEEQRKLVAGAVSRMQGIADDLLRRYRAPSAGQGAVKTAVYALGGLIEQVLSEKRLQHKDKTGVKIEFNASPGEIKALVEPKELQRLLSNLVNNSVEAFAGPGAVAVSLSALGGKVLIEVKDNGKGIPPEILAKLGQKGETHGKAGGNGLGLYHARTTVEGWGGSFKIGSEPGKGTAVLIELPRPAASISRIAILLDDDMLVHMNWKLAAKAAGVELTAFKTQEDFTRGIEAISYDTPVYIDSDLGGGLKGEEIAKELHNKGYLNLIMATGHSSEKFSHFPWLKVTGKEPPWA